MANKSVQEIMEAHYKKANACLIGNRICNVRWATKEEKKALCIDDSPLIIGMRDRDDNWIDMVIMRDPEGNGGGAVFIATPDNKLNIFGPL